MSEFFKGGFYDFDGCKVDSLPFNRRLMVLGLEAQGQVRSEEVIREAMAYPWRECIDYLFPGADQRIKSQYDYNVATYQYQLADELKVFPGVVETLQSHREQEIPLAVVSNREGSIYWLLKKKGLYEYFDAFVDVTMVKEPKPSAQPTLLGARLLGVDPGHCFGVGDSVSDILSFKAAGVGLTIGFAPGYDGERLVTANPDHVVHSYKTIQYIITNGIRNNGHKPIVWQDV